MRRVIPFIASDYRKDKIWLRRTQPKKRKYQILLAIDDSESMLKNGRTAGVMALEAAVTLTTALRQVEAGEVAVMGFGKEPTLVHPFGSTFDEAAGARLVQHFSFKQKETFFTNALDGVSAVFDDASRSRGRSRGAELTQICFIVSDGWVQDARSAVAKRVRDAEARGQAVVMVIVDDPGKQDDGKGGHSPSSRMGGKVPVTPPTHYSILDFSRSKFDASTGKLVRTPYLQDYPFGTYVVVQDVSKLPEVLCSALRQFMEMRRGI